MLKSAMVLATLISLATMLAACGNDAPQAVAVVATATPAHTPVVIVVTPTPTPTVIPAPTLMPTAIPPTPTPGDTPTPTPTPTPTATPIPPTPTPTLTPTATPTAIPPTPAPTPTPTATPIPPTPVPPTPVPPTPTATPIPPTPTPTLPSLHNTQNTRWLKSSHPALYREIQELLWAQDGLSETERETIDQLLYIGAGNIANLKAVLGLTWVQDGISETEKDAVVKLYGVAYSNSDAAAALIAMPWFQDSITETEKDAVRGLSGIAGKNSDAAAALIAMPWFQDGITETEKDAVRGLSGIAYSNSDDAAALIAMPFLDTIEADDVLAIRGMRSLANDGLLSALIDHPTLRNGITDAQTTLVAAAGTLRDAEEIRRMLNPGYATIETLSSETERTPNLKISIVRTGTQPQRWTAEGVRDAVEFAERTMQLPLPVSHIIVVLNDKAFTENYGGANSGFAFSLNPEGEQAQSPDGRRQFQSGLVHETAHYLWRGHADWIDEGVSDTFEYMYGVETSVSPGLLERPRREDCEAHDLEMLTEWDPEQEELDRFYCNYYLGQLLFLELLENLGSDEFKERLQELYRLSLAAKEADRTPGIAEVRQAFEGQSAIIEKHWSSKLNAPENRPFDEMAGMTSHDLIQWTPYPTYDGRSVTFSGTLLGDAVLMSETIKQAREFNRLPNFTLTPAAEYEFTGTILPPFNDDSYWNLDDPGDTVATEYRLEGRAFTVKFPFPKALANPSDYVVIVWGFQDETKTAFISDEGRPDILGYARIRTE